MPALTIPFETQENLQTNRGCGAACLNMVYKSFGKDVPQSEIWPLIAKQNRFGSIASTTHLMALHAIGQGLNAVVIQARHPIQVLRLCREAGIRAILNHRPRPDVATGHYTVLVDIDDKVVVVRDPAFGPSHTLFHAELTRLWQPQSANSEIAGNVVIGIAAKPVAIGACEFCHTTIPSRVDCPRCKKAVGLSPAAMLACIRDGCIARMWNYVACPACDFMWSFNEAGTSTGDMPRIAPAESPAMAIPDLNKAFAQLDKFCAHVLSIPGAANFPDLKTHMAFLQRTKDQIRLEQTNELMAIKARLDRLTAASEETKKKVEAQRKRQEELNAPLPPLDCNALSAALLKNLGFQRQPLAQR